MTNETERERLIAWLHERQMDHRDLGRVMKWSPTYIYGFLGGAWSLTQSFRETFAKTFGDKISSQIFAGPEASA